MKLIALVAVALLLPVISLPETNASSVREKIRRISKSSYRRKETKPHDLASSYSADKELRPAYEDSPYIESLHQVAADKTDAKDQDDRSYKADIEDYVQPSYSVASPPYPVADSAYPKSPISYSSNLETYPSTTGSHYDETLDISMDDAPVFQPVSSKLPEKVSQSYEIPRSSSYPTTPRVYQPVAGYKAHTITSTSKKEYSYYESDDSTESISTYSNPYENSGKDVSEYTAQHDDYIEDTVSLYPAVSPSASRNKADEPSYLPKESKEIQIPSYSVKSVSESRPLFDETVNTNRPYEVTESATFSNKYQSKTYKAEPYDEMLPITQPPPYKSDFAYDSSSSIYKDAPSYVISTTESSSAYKTPVYATASESPKYASSDYEETYRTANDPKMYSMTDKIPVYRPQVTTKTVYTATRRTESPNPSYSVKSVPESRPIFDEAVYTDRSYEVTASPTLLDKYPPKTYTTELNEKPVSATQPPPYTSDFAYDSSSPIYKDAPSYVIPTTESTSEYKTPVYLKDYKSPEYASPDYEERLRTSSDPESYSNTDKLKIPIYQLPVTAKPAYTTSRYRESPKNFAEHQPYGTRLYKTKATVSLRFPQPLFRGMVTKINFT